MRCLNVTRLLTLVIACFLVLNAAHSAEPQSLEWEMSSPLFRLAKSNNDEPATLLDPCVVKHDGSWHLFAGGPGGVMYYQLDDFKWDGPVVRGRKLSFTGGGGVPQVYFHRESKKWHLVGQMSYKDDEGKMRFTPCLSTNDKVENPEGWSKLTKMDVAPPVDEKGKPAGWMDFYVIFDGGKVHMFGTSGGRLWRTETKTADFPQGWTKPVLALKANIAYACHTYRQETEKGVRFLTTITSSAQDPESKKNRQFQVSYVAEKLDGPWKPELVKWDNPFVGFGNVKILDPRWSREIIHGEPLRDGNDERMILEREVKQFVFHAKAKLKNEESSPAIDCVGVLQRVMK